MGDVIYMRIGLQELIKRQSRSFVKWIHHEVK